MIGSLTLRRLALVLLTLPALAACSAATFAGIRPAPAVVASNLPPPEAQAVLALEQPPVPAMRPETSEAFVPFAFVDAQVRTPETSVDGLISKYAVFYGVPESLIRRVVAHESGFNPSARNGANLGLMQIRHETARAMGYSGPASGLLDADTNLRYGVKYLRGAYMVAGFNTDNAIRNYRRGYYYDAKRMGLLEETGFR